MTELLLDTLAATATLATAREEVEEEEEEGPRGVGAGEERGEERVVFASWRLRTLRVSAFASAPSAAGRHFFAYSDRSPHISLERGREREREREREGGREGGKEEGREGRKEGGREGVREGGRETLSR